MRVMGFLSIIPECGWDCQKYLLPCTPPKADGATSPGSRDSKADFNESHTCPLWNNFHFVHGNISITATRNVKDYTKSRAAGRYSQ